MKAEQMYTEPSIVEMYRIDFRHILGWEQKYNRFYRELPRELWFGKQSERAA